MANLQTYQTKITVGNLYKITEIKPRPVGDPWLTLQGAGLVNIYLAEDGATPDADPATLAEMGLSKSDTVESSALLTKPNFISIQQSSGTNTAYLSGVKVEDLGAIS